MKKNKYLEYIIYSVKTDLKLEVTNTFLGYFWWVLDPLLHMIIYTIMVTFIFKRGDSNFPIFIFSALLPWKWASSSFLQSANIIKSKASILQQIYIPKIIFPLIIVLSNGVKLFFGLLVLLLLLLLFKVKITFHFLEISFVLIVYFSFILNISLICAHYGVYIKDLKNSLSHILRIWFYLSPAMYTLDRIPSKYKIFWLMNPNTYYFESFRNVILYKKSPLYKELIILFIIQSFFIFFSILKLKKYDKSYAKVI